jgi:hypothetical protein
MPELIPRVNGDTCDNHCGADLNQTGPVVLMEVSKHFCSRVCLEAWKNRHPHRFREFLAREVS